MNSQLYGRKCETHLGFSAPCTTRFRSKRYAGPSHTSDHWLCASSLRLLSVSALHAAAWLSVIPSVGLGLHLDLEDNRTALKWWLGIATAHGSNCALCPDSALDPLGHHAVTCKRGGDTVLRHNKLRDILVESFHRAHIRVQVEAGSGLSQDHSNSQPADILVFDWDQELWT